MATLPRNRSRSINPEEVRGEGRSAVTDCWWRTCWREMSRLDMIEPEKDHDRS